MFHHLSKAMQKRMAELEAKDAADRTDGTPHTARLRQVPPQTGKFLAILAAGSPDGDWLEVGTSAGYSALWLSLACKARQKRLTTFELSPEKAALARETFALTGADAVVDLVEGDALALLPRFKQPSFCFLDAERKMLPALFEILTPRLVHGGIVAVDNVISHAHEIPDFLLAIENDQRLDSVIIPVGSGILLCRKP